MCSSTHADIGIGGQIGTKTCSNSLGNGIGNWLNAVHDGRSAMWKCLVESRNWLQQGVTHESRFAGYRGKWHTR